MLGENADEIAVLLVTELFESHVTLQTKLDIPQRSNSEELCILDFTLLAIAFTDSPELNERRDEFTLVSLSADKGKTDHEVVVNAALNDYSLLDVLQIEVDCKSFHQVELLVLDVVVQRLL